MYPEVIDLEIDCVELLIESAESKAEQISSRLRETAN